MTPTIELVQCKILGSLVGIFIARTRSLTIWKDSNKTILIENVLAHTWDMARAALRIEVTKKDRNELKKLLAGGVQPVRVVLRAISLLQMAKGVSAPQVAAVVPLTPQAIRKVGHRYQQGGP